MTELRIVAAGRIIPDAIDHIRRYCGLTWSGGEPETWAWRYYDVVPTAHDDVVTSIDVLAAASLHPGLSRADLAFFHERSAEVSSWLAQVGSDETLWDASDAVLGHVGSLASAFPAISPSLLSKVLHRKRPRLIPLLDHHVIDWYRPVTGERKAAIAWAPLVMAMRDDLADPERKLLTSIACVSLETEMGVDRERADTRGLSWLRMLDIAIWMAAR